MRTSKATPLPATVLREKDGGGTGYDKIDHASLSDVGVRRSHNQDSHQVLVASEAEQWLRGGHVFLVADGMGAHAVGELASELAASIIPHTYHKYAVEGTNVALHKAFVEANASIHARGQQNREFQGMGTTSTALVLRPDGAWVGHVGDSRAYRIRNGHIEQLSFDHSLAWELARRQGVKPDELEGIPSNVIVRSLGPEPLVQVDVEGPHPVQDGDVYVVCSDGLSNMVSDQEIGAIASELPPAEACPFLVALANLRGGLDNITVVVVRVGGIKTAEGPAPTTRRKPGFLHIHWPFSALLAGILLAAVAAGMTALGVKSSGLLAFYLSAAALMVGLGGLMLDHYREKRRPHDPAPPPPLRVYRDAVCKIDRPMVDKLAKAKIALEDWAREKKWEVDWDTQKHHHDLAEGFANQGNLAAAFREYCRAMRPLNETLQQQRQKAEVFQPLWDKKPKNENRDRK